MDLQEEESSNPGEIYQCVFCSSLFNGDSIILDCLHFICRNCLVNVPKMRNSGIQCKCKHITEKDNFSEVSVSSEFCQNVICFKNNCNDLATKICICCQYLFCGPCAIEHLERATNHDPIIKKKGFIPCRTCKKASIAIYCESCSVLICHTCQMEGHRTHQFQLLQLLGEEAKSDLKLHQSELKLNKGYFERCLNETQEHAQLLENKKKLAKIQVDKTMLLLHEQINQRSSELKKEIDNCFLDTMAKLDENKEVILESKKKNLYYDRLISTVCNESQVMDIINMSIPLKKKLEIAKVNLLKTPIDLKSFQSNLEFSSEGTLISGLLAIKAVGKITSTMVIQPGSQKSLSPYNQEPYGSSIVQASGSQMDIKPICINESDNNYQVNDYPVSYQHCNCCNQWITESDICVSCPSCSRDYHNDCHIPPLPANATLTMGNPCTMCTDLSTYVERLSRRCRTFIFNKTSKSEQKILQRLLMEVYCQNNNSDSFRTLPSYSTQPWYSQKIGYPMSLNHIRNLLNTDEMYSFGHCILDMKQVFANAMIIHPRSNPTYIEAKALFDHLASIFAIYVPRFNFYSFPN